MSTQKLIEKIGIRLTSEELKLAKQMAKDLEPSVSELFRYKTLRSKGNRERAMGNGEGVWWGI